MANSISLIENDNFKNVQGWMNPNVPIVVDAWASHYIDELKQDFSSTIEIGVHHGRFFLILEAVTPPSNKCYAYDLFEDAQEKNIDGSGKGNREIFEKNVSLIARNKDRVVAIQGDSFSIRASPLPHRFTLFSIDGGHTREHTVFDLKYANDTIVPGGLIILDDFTNPNWLGVMEGVIDFLNDSDRRICPFMAGYNKLLFTTISEANSIQKAIEDKIPQRLKGLSPLRGHLVRGLG